MRNTNQQQKQFPILTHSTNNKLIPKAESDRPVPNFPAAGPGALSHHMDFPLALVLCHLGTLQESACARGNCFHLTQAGTGADSGSRERGGQGTGTGNLDSHRCASFPLEGKTLESIAAWRQTKFDEASSDLGWWRPLSVRVEFGSGAFSNTIPFREKKKRARTHSHTHTHTHTHSHTHTNPNVLQLANCRRGQLQPAGNKQKRRNNSLTADRAERVTAAISGGARMSKIGNIKLNGKGFP